MDSFKSTEYVNDLSAALRAGANAEYAPYMAKYMKNLFPFYGIKSPERKIILREHIHDKGYPPNSKLLETARLMWDIQEREAQYAAMDLLGKRKKYLDAGSINFLEYLVITKSWWDTVDFIAATLIGSVFQRFPELIGPTTQRWMTSRNMWLQRSCILFQLKYKSKTDEKLLYGFITDCKDSKEFFIRKAIGWALREYAKYNPQSVIQFVQSANIQGLSRREALKHLNK